MWVDSWGNEYETKEDAEQNVIDNYMTDFYLKDELEYHITTRDLLDFIFNDEVVFNKFDYTFGDIVDAIEHDYAMDNIEEWNGEVN